jgi:hypothetical protein
MNVFLLPRGARAIAVLTFIALASCRTVPQPAPEGLAESESQHPIAEVSEAWPGGRVPYEIDESLQSHRDLIATVMRRWENGTPVRFVARTAGDPEYVRIERGGCTTFDRGNISVVRADSACIGHELGHALGLHHEHQRPDRDRYITVDTPRWWLWGQSQYRVIPQRLCRPYDLGSIMHYDIRYIVPRDGMRITRRDNEPSASDLLSVRQLYGAAPCVEQPAP